MHTSLDCVNNTATKKTAQKKQPLTKSTKKYFE